MFSVFISKKKERLQNLFLWIPFSNRIKNLQSEILQQSSHFENNFFIRNLQKMSFLSAITQSKFSKQNAYLWYDWNLSLCYDLQRQNSFLTFNRHIVDCNKECHSKGPVTLTSNFDILYIYIEKYNDNLRIFSRIIFLAKVSS